MGRPNDEIPMVAYRRPGQWVNGDWNTLPGVTVINFVGGRPQPAGPELVEMLPEGARSTARFVFWVQDDQPTLQTIDDDGTEAADYIEWRGSYHVLVSLEDWSNLPLGHHAYAMIAVAPDEELP